MESYFISADFEKKSQTKEIIYRYIEKIITVIAEKKYLRFEFLKQAASRYTFHEIRAERHEDTEKQKKKKIKIKTKDSKLN